MLLDQISRILSIILLGVLFNTSFIVSAQDNCAFEGTLTVGGGTWDTEIGWTLSLEGVEIASGVAPSTQDLCPEAGCYVFEMTDSYGDGWNGGTYSFDGLDGVNIYLGDVDTAAVGDGSSVGTDYLDFNGGACPYGCTDSNACNYDTDALNDDGSCEYATCDCQEDLNGDGVISVADILVLLGEFGCTSGCTADINGDDATNVQDILLLLAAFGTTCE